RASARRTITCRPSHTASTPISDCNNSSRAGAAPARELLLQSLIGVLAVWLGRQVMVRRAEARPGRGQEYL
ncbi:hypothetical protein ACV34F_30045, partial [Pseudomonas aeruginosa]